MWRFGLKILSVCAVVSMAASWRVDALDTDAEKPLVFATAWGKTLAQDGTGFYNEIASDILARTQDSEQYIIRPYRRAKVSFFARKNSCLYPSSLTALVNADQIADADAFIESNGLFTARTHLFVRAGETPPKQLSEIFGKTIAYPNGSVVRSVLEGHGARLISVNNEEDKAEMLLTGRVDMISGMIPDTAIVFSSLGKSLPVYHRGLALYEVAVTFVCHRSDQNAAFIKAVNEALAAMSQDPVHRARMEAANLALDELERSSGNTPDADGHSLNDITPSAGGHADKPVPGSRPNRRLPKRVD